ncbi:MAG: GAF domain-containing protein [Streptosporangiales bacterium]|nr:GAF domain-containing protein [Streptosporangiales bacterium]MBO0890914.1 GAF domain-containing protein [Acidothermales bacterium]
MRALPATSGDAVSSVRIRHTPRIICEPTETQGRTIDTWRNWVAPTLTGVFIVVTSVTGALAGHATGTTQTDLITVQAVSALLAFLVPTIAQARERRRFRLVQEERIAARTEMRMALNDALDPIVRHLGRIAAASRRDRETLRGQAVPFVLNAATEVLGPDRARACWFVLEDARPVQLRPETCVGRAGGEREAYVAGTRRGDDLLRMIEYDEDRFYPDVDEVPPIGWDVTAPHDYKTFACVPVISGNIAYGMITLDAPEAGQLTRDDVRLLRLLAGMLGNALGIDP